MGYNSNSPSHANDPGTRLLLRRLSAQEKPSIYNCSVLHHICRNKLNLGVVGLQHGLWPQLPRHNRQPVTSRIKQRRHTRHQPRPRSNHTHLTRLRVPAKVRRNHASTNHWRMRRKSPLPLSANIHRALVNTHLRTNRPLGMES